MAGSRHQSSTSSRRSHRSQRSEGHASHAEQPDQEGYFLDAWVNAPASSSSQHSHHWPSAIDLPEQTTGLAGPSTLVEEARPPPSRSQRSSKSRSHRHSSRGAEGVLGGSQRSAGGSHRSHHHQSTTQQAAPSAHQPGSAVQLAAINPAQLHIDYESDDNDTVRAAGPTTGVGPASQRGNDFDDEPAQVWSLPGEEESVLQEWLQLHTAGEGTAYPEGVRSHVPSEFNGVSAFHSPVSSSRGQPASDGFFPENLLEARPTAGTQLPSDLNAEIPTGYHPLEEPYSYEDILREEEARILREKEFRRMQAKDSVYRLKNDPALLEKDKICLLRNQEWSPSDLSHLQDESSRTHLWYRMRQWYRCNQKLHRELQRLNSETEKLRSLNKRTRDAVSDWIVWNAHYQGNYPSAIDAVHIMTDKDGPLSPLDTSSRQEGQLPGGEEPTWAVLPTIEEGNTAQSQAPLSNEDSAYAFTIVRDLHEKHARTLRKYRECQCRVGTMSTRTWAQLVEQGEIRTERNRRLSHSEEEAEPAGSTSGPGSRSGQSHHSKSKGKGKAKR